MTSLRAEGKRSSARHPSPGPPVGQLVHAIRLVGANVEHLIISRRYVDRLRHDRSDIANVAEGARLGAVPKDRHRLVLQDLVHEDAHHVAVFIADILPLAVNVVRPEDDASPGRTSPC